MLTRVLEVSEAAEGEWPTKFMNLAQQLELDEGISDLKHDIHTSRAEIAMAFHNTLFCEVRGWNAETEQMTKAEPILKENFPDVYEEWTAEEMELQLQYVEQKWKEINDLAFAPDNDTIAVGTRELELFSDEDRKITASGKDLGYGERPESRNLNFSPDGSFLTAAWTGVSLHDTEDLSKISNIHGGGECRVTISPDGDMLATHPNQSSGEVWLWRAIDDQEFEKIAEFAPDAGWIHGIEFTPEGKHLAGGFRDGKVKLWNVDSHELELTIDFDSSGGSYNLNFSADGTKLIASEPDLAGEIYIFNLEDGTRVEVLDPGDSRVSSMQISPDGTKLAVGRFDGVTIILDTTDWSQLYSFEHEGVVRALSFSPDNSKLAVGTGEGNLYIYEYESH